jgi:hypothetical protein
VLKLEFLLTAWFKNKYIEILIVLFIIPLILNIFMFWVVDNILMQSQGCLYVIVDWIKKLPKLLFCKCFGGCWKKKRTDKNKRNGLPSDEEGMPVLLAKNSESDTNHVISSNANTNRNNNTAGSESICDMSPVFTSRVKKISASIDTACDSVRNLVENALSSHTSEQHTRLPSEIETEENNVINNFEAEVPRIL